MRHADRLEGVTALSGTELLLNVLGGVALLIWGTRMVRTGVLRAYGADLRRLLAASTRNRVTAWLTGLGVTALLQSATATATLTTSFAGRELIAVAPALAVMLGADVGSSLVAQVFTLNVTAAFPVLLFLGVACFMASEAPRIRHFGRIAIGLGLMLLALHLIRLAAVPINDSDLLHALFAALASEPLLAFLLAGALTWLAHSSLAVVLLIASLAATGAIPLDLAFVLVLGANAGAALPALTATLNEAPQARRVPLGNLLFRVTGAVILLPLLPQVTPHLAEFGAEPIRQVANAHLGFNLLLTVVFIGLTGPVARLTEQLLPAPATADDDGQPRHLDTSALDSPNLALAAATRETLRLADLVENMLGQTIEVFQADDKKLKAEVEAMDDQVDALHESIKLYLTEFSREPLSGPDSERCIDIITFATNLEHVGDIIDKNLMELARKKIRNRYQFSEEGMSELVDLHHRVMATLKLSLSVFLAGDVDGARELLLAKERFCAQERQATENHLARLRSGRTASIETSALHLDMLRDLKRIHSHLTAVAYPILDQAGELAASRLKQRGGTMMRHPIAPRPHVNPAT